MNLDKTHIVYTQKDLCRGCYTCVRKCPAKAIRFVGGQAEVLQERCIGCGKCVTVCRQGAQKVLSAEEDVFRILKSDNKTAALLSPTFPAEFHDTDYRKLVGMIRELGFDYVFDVSFGVDLVARKTFDLQKESDGQSHITSTCPAVFSYVYKFYPDLTDYLVPYVSPMIAMDRVVKEIHGNDLKTVFIGPCISRKGEAASEEVSGEVSEVLTFVELRRMFRVNRICKMELPLSDFDPPTGYKGGLYPIHTGFHQAVDIHEDLIDSPLISQSGPTAFVEAIKEFSSGNVQNKMLEILCCKGCIMGAGMRTGDPLFRRRTRISQHMREVIKTRDKKEWEKNYALYENIDMSRTFKARDQRIEAPNSEEITEIYKRIGRVKLKDRLNCGACGYLTCRDHATAIHKGLAEEDMCLPHTIEKLHIMIKELALSHDQLSKAKDALKQSEKLASMGQLAAGIAHELNNPLGVVLMYSEMILDDLQDSGNDELNDDLEIISKEATRCKKIVSGLLNFSRKNKITTEPTDIVDLVEHCIKTTVMPENIEAVVSHKITDRIANIDHDQIIQVFSNLLRNALRAMDDGGKLTIITEDDNKNIYIVVTDTGIGIPEENLSKIFEPFFTTKVIGQGIGLGLAVAYGIVKMHSGKIKVKSNADKSKGATGTTFTITLPRK
ncbi:MAG: 4Fe-4S binding protein [Chlorobi bacterium]|nr:4Fe-4S binding protein [Chlorobiota bacterium]